MFLGGFDSPWESASKCRKMTIFGVFGTPYPGHTFGDIFVLEGGSSISFQILMFSLVVYCTGIHVEKSDFWSCGFVYMFLDRGGILYFVPNSELRFFLFRYGYTCTNVCFESCGFIYMFLDRGGILYFVPNRSSVLLFVADGYTCKKEWFPIMWFHIYVFQYPKTPPHPNPLQNGAQPYKLGYTPIWDTPPLFGTPHLHDPKFTFVAVYPL